MLELHNDVNRFIEHAAREVKKHIIKYKKYEFYEVKVDYVNLYFVYESKANLIANRLAGYELKENGLILEKNNEFLYYNFEEKYEKKEEIIKEFVEKYYSDI